MKKSILLLLIISFVGLCAYLFVVFYDEAEKTAIRRLNDQQQIHAQQAAHGIQDYFATWTGILSSFSQMDTIISVNADGKRYMSLFYEAHSEQIRSITRVDERGRILHTVPYSGSIASDISEQKHMRVILRDHKPVVSDVFRTVQGFDAVALHVPVFQGADFKGTIAIVIDFENLAKRYLEVIKIGRTGQAWVVSRDGTMLYSPVRGSIGKSIFDTSRDSPTIIAMTKDMLQGHQGTATYISANVGGKTVSPGKKYAVYFPIHIADSFWSIVVASSSDEVLASLASFRNRLLLVIGMMLLGGVVFTIISARAWLIVAEEKKRKRAEEELRRSEQKFMKAFHATPDAIVISRAADGLLLEVNEVFLRIAGYSRDEVLNKTTVDLGLWANPADRDRYIAGVRQQGRVQDMEAQFRTKAGELHDGLVSGESIVLGDELCLLTIIRDITELKKTAIELEKHRLHLEEMVAERTAELNRSQDALRGSFEEVTAARNELEAANNKLKELDRLKSMFIASMSHELRTPLNSIIGFTGIILQGMTGEINDEQRDQLQRVSKAGKHLLALITDVIDISKIEAGKIEAYAEEFSVDTVLNEALSELKLQIKDKKLEIEVIMIPEKIILKTDRKRLFQCVLNYLSNAVKYTEKGKITVVAEEKGDKMQLKVTDTGIGIKEEDLPMLFRSFVRLDSSLKMTVAGTGLGLYLTKKLATEVLGGQVEAASTYGKGSTFSLSIPKNLRSKAG